MQFLQGERFQAASIRNRPCRMASARSLTRAG
jgi:hypothetical protein